MKRHTLLYYCSFLLVLLLSACETATSDNGDLDGLWQMTIKENLMTGDVEDMRQYQVTWSFQGGMVQLNVPGKIPGSHVIGKFTHGEDYIRIYHLAVFSHGHGDDVITDPSMIERAGFYRLDETFKVLELNSDVLRVETDKVRIAFRKY